MTISIEEKERPKALSVQQTAELNQKIESACVRACEMIAPAWPLDRAIAVNPHWMRIGLPIAQVAARMAVLSNIKVFPSRDYFAQLWRDAKLSREELQQAVDQHNIANYKEVSPVDALHRVNTHIEAKQNQVCTDISVDSCIAALTEPNSIHQLPLLIDLLDNDPARSSRMPWRQAITHQVSQTCAAYFDQNQADWRPDTSSGLYSFWRETLKHDQGIGVLMGLPHLSDSLDALPPSREAAQNWVMQRIDLPEQVWADYLESVLLTVNGWASWCAYLSWQAKLEAGQDEHLRDLLAIRLAWGAILLDATEDSTAKEAFQALQHAWVEAPQVIDRACDSMRIDEIWQLATEIRYQNDLKKRLVDTIPNTNKPSLTPSRSDVQAAFCIDVRSEPMRRALESVSPGMQTLGFAGFFGLPLAYTPIATAARRPQLPGLLAPSIEIGEQIQMPAMGSNVHISSQTVIKERSARLALTHRAGMTSRWPATAFSFVEAAGVGYLARLWQWVSPSRSARVNDDHAGLSAANRAVCRPMLLGLDTSAKVDLAAKVLHAMGLDKHLSPLVVLVGHGSQSHNNAQAAALDCGACCGQTGEVNARGLALMLNDSEVRDGLKSRGTLIPIDTWFVAALHNTTTDELEGFDTDLLSGDAQSNWRAFETVWNEAADQVRRERAPSLGIDATAAYSVLLASMQLRANDGAQTRPEWGLAGNAAFIIAPRSRTEGVALQGRSFLHDYDANSDEDASLLELLMTAPMLVTHWINWQYHASTCDPLHLGSGNKLLHNVVGGNIGVFEGNGGDLRIGLSQQSIHNGEVWIHEPLRLTVLIDAPRERIDQIIAKHSVLQNLLNNGWLHLWRFKDSEPKNVANSVTAEPNLLFERYQQSGWVECNN